MKGSRKISWIRLLMIISHLLLTLFVINWLASRYGQEKDSLKKELQSEFVASENKMIDSLLLIKVVNPFLQSNCKQNVKMVVMTGIQRPDLKGDKKNIFFSKTDTSSKKNNHKDHAPDTVKISINSSSNIYTAGNLDSVKVKSNFFIDSIESSDFRDRFLIQSIKVLTGKVADTMNSSKPITLKFTNGFDSSIVRKDFLKKDLVKNFRIAWDKGNASKDKSAIRLETISPEYSLNADVYSYQVYLFRKISPQIIFGIVLVLLTGAAFVISFVSLKNQVVLNRIRNDFVGNISHELKTPVSTVKVALEALQNFNIKDEPAKADEYIQIAQIEINRLELLIQKVLTSSIYEEANEIMRFEPISLYELANEVVNSMQIRLAQADAKISIRSDENVSLVLGDRLHLQGVLINLIDNSLKYVDGRPSILIEVCESNESVILTLSDNGVGIPEEYHKKVFEKFFRVPTDNRHNVKGYGLGLSYAEMVMKQHKGSIGVENLKESGCKFTLTLPKFSG